MSKRVLIFSGLLLLLFNTVVQAVPVISVQSEDFSMSAYARLVDGDGAVTHYQDSYQGSALDGDREVDALNEWVYSQESYSGKTIYEEFSLEANANISWYGNGFNLWAESDKYPTGWSEDTPPATYYPTIELGAVVSLSWTFSVTGGDVDVGYYVADEHVRNQGDYPPGWDDESVSRISIFDETLNLAVVNATGWLTGGSASLLDGHTYRLEMVARDDHFPSSYLNEEDVDTGLFFSEAQFVSVAEPSALLLIGIGMLWLVVIRTFGRFMDGSLVARSYTR